MSKLNKNIRFAIFVFSYNRGKYLENCILSIRNLMNSYPIYIVDDDSTEPYTLQVLNNLSVSNGIEILNFHIDKNTSEEYRGGFYCNMQKALEFAREKGVEIALFIEDDMQIVRRVHDNEIEKLKKIFEMLGNSTFQIRDKFIKKRSEARYKLDVHSSKLFYHIIRGVRINYTSHGLYHVSKFFKLHGKLAGSEAENNEICFNKGLSPVLFAHPFIHWIPYPQSYRCGKRNWKLKLIEWLGNAGLHPIRYMSKEEVDVFLKRDLEIYPIAEDFLDCATIDRPIWSTTGGHGNLTAQNWFKKKLSRFLVYLHIR